MQKHYIPKAQHAKAIAHFMRQHECDTYPLREINGMHGGLIRTLDRKKPVNGLRVYFLSNREDYGTHKRTTSFNLTFERTY